MGIQQRVAQHDERALPATPPPARSAVAAYWRHRALADRALVARLMLTLGLLFFGAGLDELWAHRHDRFEPVPARVASAEVQARDGIEVGGVAEPPSLYVPVVRVAYAQGGQARQAALELSGVGTREWAERKLAAYPVGAALTVWVDPAQPERARRSGRSGGSVVGVALGLLLSALGLARLRQLQP